MRFPYCKIYFAKIFVLDSWTPGGLPLRIERDIKRGSTPLQYWQSDFKSRLDLSERAKIFSLTLPLRQPSWWEPIRMKERFIVKFVMVALLLGDAIQLGTSESYIDEDSIVIEGNFTKKLRLFKLGVTFLKFEFPLSKFPFFQLRLLVGVDSQEKNVKQCNYCTHFVNLPTRSRSSSRVKLGVHVGPIRGRKVNVPPWVNATRMFSLKIKMWLHSYFGI